MSKGVWGEGRRGRSEAPNVQPGARTARALTAALVASAALTFAAAASADPPAPHQIGSYSAYEKETITIGLQQTGHQLEESPEGKIIEGIDTFALDVFEPRDPLPGPIRKIANFFHVTTKPHYVERELLFHVGDAYRRPIIEESARNLRTLPQLTVVLVLPVKGSAPDRVRILVVTKDLWSLRLATEYRFSSGTFELLQLQLTEINLFGTHHQIAGNFFLDPAVIAVGGAFTAPRLVATRLRFAAEANVIVNRDSGAVEGSFGAFQFTKPLFSLATEWSYGATMQWTNGITRRFIGSQVGAFQPSTGRCRRPYSGPSETTAAPEIPCTYSRDVQQGSLFITRSYGTAYKHNIRLAMEASRRVFRTFDLSEYPDRLSEAYERLIPPVSDTKIGPALQYQTFEARYMRALDVNRLGLQEEYQLGHHVLMKVSPTFQALRSTRDVLSLYAAASYTVPLGDGIARAFVETGTDYDFGAGKVSDGSIDVGARIITPRFGIGRLILDGHLLYRYANYLNINTSLGGDTRLRGFPTGAFQGKDVLAVNLEYRSRPVEILSCQVGGALFYDLGDAFVGFGDMRLKHTAGFGVRAMFPQINRVVMRADWAFPLQPGYLTKGYVDRDGFPGELVVTFSQAFPMPSLPLSQATDQ